MKTLPDGARRRKLFRGAWAVGFERWGNTGGNGMPAEAALQDRVGARKVAGGFDSLLRQRNQMNSARRCAAAEREDGGLRILVDGELASERCAGVRVTCIAISPSGV